MISSVGILREKVLEKYTGESLEYKSYTGIFKQIRYVKLGFFQSEHFFYEQSARKLKIKPKWLKEAERFLASAKNKYKVFVHIRRGDYKNYKVYGKTSLLPIEYFHKQIKCFLEHKENVCFVFLSDEPEFIDKEFSYLSHKLISENSYEVDFAIMSLCSGAVLSPSSFGWWGSYLMQERDIVFAPEHWLGFASGEDYQKNPIAHFMTQIKII